MEIISNQPQYDLSKLDFWNKTIAKNWCLANTKKIFWMLNVFLWWSAAEAIIYSDKKDFKTFRVWDVLIIWKNSPVFSNSPAWKTYWHIWVIISIDENNVIMNDWQLAYPNLKINIQKLLKWTYWVISPSKMIDLGATKIKKEDLYSNIIINMINNYKEIFKKEFPNGSSIFKDLDSASKDLTTPEQIAYFIAIWLERLKNLK